MILKFKLECRLKMKYRPFSKNVFGGKGGAENFMPRFIDFFIVLICVLFYALLKGYFRREKCPLCYAQGTDFCTFYECL